MKNVYGLGSLAALLIGLGLAHGQGLLPVSGPPATVPPATGPAPVPAVPSSGPSLEVSPWLAYPRNPLCCTPTGADGPIGAEAYVRTGVSIPFGGGAISQMRPGYTMSFGARTLLFNPQQDNAWVLDFGLGTVWYNTRTSEQFTLLNTDRTFTVNGQQTRVNVPVYVVTPDGLNQTTVNVSVGREWYLWGSASCEGQRCRAGVDLGGRYGSCRFDLVDDRHRTDTVGGFFLAAHSDVEIPYGCCIVQFGGRLEYGYIWSDVLQSRNDTDVQSVNILFTAGLRF